MSVVADFHFSDLLAPLELVIYAGSPHHEGHPGFRWDKPQGLFLGRYDVGEIGRERDQNGRFYPYPDYIERGMRNKGIIEEDSTVGLVLGAMGPDGIIYERPKVEAHTWVEDEEGRATMSVYRITPKVVRTLPGHYMEIFVQQSLLIENMGRNRRERL
jgi:hypothetical protein